MVNEGLTIFTWRDAIRRYEEEFGLYEYGSWKWLECLMVKKK